MTVILLHGAWQGSWVWSHLTPMLKEAGLHPHAIDLPGNGTDDVAPADVSLDLYVQHVARKIAEAGGRAHVVAHSGAGVIASQIAEAYPERVLSLSYIAGMMLPNDTSFADVVADVVHEEPAAKGIGPYLEWSEDRLVSRVPPNVARHIFFHDCPGEVVEDAVHRLTPQSERGRAIRPRISAERFGKIRRLYIGASHDRSVVFAAQKRMQQLVPGAKVTTLDTGHAPHVAAPQKLAACLIPWLKEAS
jgi:pimeloyl-ACP methyl ester carboxylesterase